MLHELAGRGPHMKAVEEELSSQHQEPDPKRKTQRTAWDAVCQQGSGDGSYHSAGDQVRE